MIKTQALKEALNLLDVIAPSRTTLSILKTLLLQTLDGKLYITANNTNCSLCLNMDYDEQNIDLCIPAKEFKNIVATIQEDVISFVIKDQTLILHDGKHKTKFKCLSSDEFPQTQAVQPGFQLDGLILKSLLTKAAISCSNNLSSDSTSLTGINLHSENGILVIQAADTFRASHIRMMLGTQDFNIIIQPIDKRLFSLLEGKLNIHITENKITISNSKFTYTSSLIAGAFPDLARMIPQSKNTTIVVNKQKIRNAIRRAMIFAKDNNNVVIISIKDNSIQIKSSNVSGENDMMFNIIQEGNNIEFAVNGKFIQDFLTVCEENAIVELTDPKHPIVLRIPGNDSFIYITMPMHIEKYK